MAGDDTDQKQADFAEEVRKYIALYNPHADDAVKVVVHQSVHAEVCNGQLGLHLSRAAFVHTLEHFNHIARSLGLEWDPDWSPEKDALAAMPDEAFVEA